MIPERFKQRALLVFSVVLLTAITFFTVFPGDDPYRCRAGIQTGRWIDPPTANGSRAPYHTWQPDGCTLKEYSSDDIRSCMAKRSFTFAGDSTSRNPMWEAGRMLVGKKKVKHTAAHTDAHGSFNVTFHDIKLSKDMNVWLHTKGVDPDEDVDPFQEDLDLYRTEKELGFDLPISQQRGAALFYLSAGVWYTKTADFGDLDYHARAKIYTEALTNVSEALGPNNGKTFWNQPMDPEDGVGNQLFYIPPHGPRSGPKSRNQTQEMRDWLAKNEDKMNMPIVWGIPKMVEGQFNAWNTDHTGFHVRAELNVARNTVVLNARCNARLDRMRPYEQGTCCTDYGYKTYTQTLTLSLAVAWLILCVAFSVQDLVAPSSEPRSTFFSMQAAGFPLVLVMCYFADRTQMMAKGDRVFIDSTFYAFVLLIAVALLATVRRTTPTEGQKGYQPISEQLPQLEVDTFLNRAMTEEWKGFMQLGIIIYHWCRGSSEQTVYITIRLFVASYLFQTGYGHTVFYLDKADFSFQRVASTLLRLNLLSFGLTFIMNTDLMVYYFAPLCSFWYLAVYGTFAIGKKFNQSPRTLVPKIALAGCMTSGLIAFTPFVSWTHTALTLVFNARFSESEWHERLMLDMFVVYVGMLTAVLAQYCSLSTFQSGIRVSLAICGAIVCVAYVYMLQDTTIDEYKANHALLSIFPVLGYVALRNVSSTVRNYHSRAMAWVGRCSLETYILQVHLLMAENEKSVLLVDGLSGGDAILTGRWASLVIIFPIFLWVSSAASKSTRVVVEMIMQKSDEEGEKSSDTLGKIKSVITTPAFKLAAVLVFMWTMSIASPLPQEVPTF